MFVVLDLLNTIMFKVNDAKCAFTLTLTTSLHVHVHATVKNLNLHAMRKGNVWVRWQYETKS